MADWATEQGMDEEYYEGLDAENEYECTMIAETPLAWLMDLGDGVQEWLPKSRCTFKEGIRRLGMVTGVILIPEWLVRRKGL